VRADYSLDFAPASLTLARVTSPFRDEVESLRRENERLRAELARTRHPSAGRTAVAFALIGVDVLTAMVLRPWLNAGSDARFWGALVILGAITLAAGGAGLSYKRHGS